MDIGIVSMRYAKALMDYRRSTQAGGSRRAEGAGRS